VTLKISESVFKKPVVQGDYLEFMCNVVKFGTSSLTIGCTVETKDLADHDKRDVVFTCEVVFVMIDPDTGKSVAHGKQEVRKA
jgi:acyl-CoA hydrolase